MLCMLCGLTVHGGVDGTRRWLGEWSVRICCWMDVERSIAARTSQTDRQVPVPADSR